MFGSQEPDSGSLFKVTAAEQEEENQPRQNQEGFCFWHLTVSRNTTSENMETQTMTLHTRAALFIII